MRGVQRGEHVLGKDMYKMNDGKSAADSVYMAKKVY